MNTAASVAAASHYAGPLAAFYDGLAALERGDRAEHLRIEWLGDSHAQADFWTGHVRSALQRRFGSAGPGFVHVGFKHYRHDGVDIEIEGRWRMRPKKPSTVQPWGDGAFGLGGVLNAGFAGRRRVRLSVTDEHLKGQRLLWDLCFKHGLARDRFRLRLDSGDEKLIEPAGEADIGKIQHLELESTGPAELELVVLRGRPDFCGVVIESDPAAHPGVVLDNLGINGARYGTALAWNEAAWAAELRRRAPLLLVFEYGGNEASDPVVRPGRYRQQALDLIARARRAAPQASCLVVAPADRADAEAKIPPIVEAERAAAAEAGCAFWDTYRVMGGRGSLAKWRDDGRAAPDGVHLKPKGYAAVAALFMADLLAGYHH